MSTSPLDLLLAHLRECQHGGAWHGPAFDEALAAFSPREAAAHPVPGAHSAWELALHATAWTREVARRLEAGVVAALPSEGDWPAAPSGEAVTAAAWAETRVAASAAVEDLVARAVQLGHALTGRLHLPVPRPPNETPDDALGTRHDYGAMLAGLAAHLAYHAGQLAILRRALDARQP